MNIFSSLKNIGNPEYFSCVVVTNLDWCLWHKPHSTLICVHWHMFLFLYQTEDRVLALSVFVDCVAMQWSGAEFPESSSVAVDPSPLLQYCPVNSSMLSSSWAWLTRCQWHALTGPVLAPTVSLDFSKFPVDVLHSPFENQGWVPTELKLSNQYVFKLYF